MSFGTNLEHLRKDRNISQAKLGSTLGLTQQMISSYENETSSPNIDVLLKIANYFNVSLDILVDHSPQTQDMNSAENRLLRYFQTLTAADKERCIIIVKTIVEDRELGTKKKRKAD